MVHDKNFCVVKHDKNFCVVKGTELREVMRCRWVTNTVFVQSVDDYERFFVPVELHLKHPLRAFVIRQTFDVAVNMIEFQKGGSG